MCQSMKEKSAENCENLSRLSSQKVIHRKYNDPEKTTFHNSLMKHVEQTKIDIVISKFQIFILKNQFLVF